MLQPAAIVALAGAGSLCALAWAHALVDTPGIGLGCLIAAGTWLLSLALAQRRLRRDIAVPLERAAAQIDRFSFRVGEPDLASQSTAETVRIAKAVERLCERALERAQHDNAIFLASRDAIVTVDHTGRIETFSPTAEEMFGWTATDIVGQNLDRLLPEVHSPRPADAAPFRGGESAGRAGTAREVVALRGDGTTFPASVYVKRVDRGKQPPMFCNVFRDLTEQAHAEQAMLRHATQVEQANVELAQAKFEAEDARAEAEAANRSKSDFLANMSHEIRTPMTAILGFAETLLDPSLEDAERREAIDTILRNGGYLMRLINDILDLSKIEAGRLSIERLPLSPIGLVADVASLMRVHADARRLRLDVRYECPLPATVRSDPTRLRQVLINLCGNAIKFTESGGVTLTLRLVRPRPSDALLQFEVRDTGIGMSAQELERLFEPFAQADGSTSRRFGGTGLGLSISRRLVQMLGGEIEVVSEPGIGSAFTFTIDPGPLVDVPMLEDANESLAARRVAEPPAPQRSQSAARRLGGRVLLAEDGPDNQRLITRLLKKNGIEVTVVGDGRSAVQTVLAAEGGRTPFDLVLMDMQMPVMDGYQATIELRRVGFRKPIVALTANAMAGDRERCLGAGCTDFTPKPVERQVLLEVLDRLLPQTPEA